MSTIVIDLPEPDHWPVSLDFPGVGPMDDAAFDAFCQSRPDLRIEMDRDGNLIVMHPVEPFSGNKELRLGAQLERWADRDGRGLAFSSSTMFTLPSGAKRSPDASWTPLDVIDRLRQSGGNGRVAHHCPFFVLELRSATDRLPPLLAKMEEWIENGARLGILIDPREQTARIYRPDQASPELLSRPDQLAGDPEMPGLIFDLTKVW